MLLIVVESFVGIVQRALLDLSVLVGVDQVPVDILHLADRGNDLSLEAEVGKLQILLSDVDEALVGGKSKALQQRLVDREVETCSDLRAEDVEDAVRGLPEAKVESP